MPSRKMTVTKNVEYCLKTLKKAVNNLPDSAEQKTAKDAINYLIDTAAGKVQMYKGAHCNHKKVIPPSLLPRDHKYYKP
jgi:hypothetical protein